MNKFCIAALSILALASCHRKDKDPITPVCSYKLWGAYTPAIRITDTASAGEFGPVDTVGGHLSAVSIFNSAYSKQGAYNNADECYYTFKTVKGSYTGRILCRVTAGSSVSYLDNASSVKDSSYQAITFNKVNSKLYCLYSDTANKIGEVTISGSTFSVAQVAQLQDKNTIFTSLAADNNSGALYCLSGDINKTYIDKYVLGATSMTRVCTLPFGWESVMGLRHNVNDNKLYLTRITTSGTSAEIGKIDPSNGQYSVLVNIAGYMDREYFSAVIDPCHNEYVLSTRTGVGWTSQVYARVRLADGVVYKNSTGGIYTGLDVQY